MEEILYTIEIFKKNIEYFGKIFSTSNEIKEFYNKKLEDLLRDIVKDIELDHDISYNRPIDFFEDTE